MTTNSTTLFDLAQLAEASYAKFDQQGTRDALVTEGFSNSQATDFATHWAVVDHLPNTASGFSATLFKRIDNDPLTGVKAGDLVFALRGTEQVGMDLFEACFNELVKNGLAFRQIIDMYNYWQRLITPVGEWAKQATLVPASSSTPDSQLIDESGIKWTIDLGYRATGLGKVGLSDNLMAATGHSLGGHLATAFTRLFPAWGKRAVTFNGAGYPTGLIPGLSLTAQANIPNLFSMLGGEADFRPSDIVNLYGDKNAEIVTMNSFFGLMQPGDHQSLFIEQDTVYASTFGHGVGQMADSAAVYDLLIRIARNLQNATAGAVLAQLKPVFEAASPTRNMSLENLVNALGDLFKVGAKIAATDDRQKLYERIVLIRNAVAGTTTLIPLATTSRDTLVTEAQRPDATGLAYRYALKELNPFVVLGADYAQHNQNGELDLYDPATGSGTLSELYLADRAAFLTWKNKTYTEDTDVGRVYDGSAWHFKDEAGGAELWVGNPYDVKSSPQLRHLVFGGAGSDTLDGGKGADRLEGGTGTDVYVIQDSDGSGIPGGLHGADMLDGGTGNDTLWGNGGDDMLFGNVGDGLDMARADYMSKAGYAHSMMFLGCRGNRLKRRWKEAA